MLRNYLTSALRHLAKNKSYTLLNALGLSVGLACFTLIGLWVMDELSFDRFHTKSDRIYRVAGIFKSESDKIEQAVTPTPLRTALVSDLPEVEESVIIDNNDAIVERGSKQFMEDYLLMTESSFFRMFDFKLLAGDERKALTEPYTIVLSESLAKKYFGNENPLGQTLNIYLQDPEGRGRLYTVTGVIEDCPQNSHITYTGLISFKTFEVNNPPTADDWYNNGYYTYTLLREGSDPASLQGKLPGLVEKYMGKQNREWKISYEYRLQPLTDIHLNSHLSYEIKPTGSTANVVIFGTVGVFVLLLACINYINLSTAFSTSRFKEVSMRKVMGAHQSQLVGQYLAESWLLAIVSLAVALGWIELVRPVFETITEKQITGLYSPGTLLALAGITTLVGLISGFYPALMLSAFRPASIMKGQLKSGSGGVLLRKGLVVFQYAIAILLVVGILTVQQQLNFIKGRDLGFNQDGLMVFGVNGSQQVLQGYEAFANEVRQLPFVEGIARSNTTLAGGLGNSVGTMQNADGQSMNATIYRLRTDFDYLDTHQMNLLAGRFFKKENAADSSKAWVVNQAMMRAFGYQSPEAIIGKPFQFQGRTGEVIGVVKDSHYTSLQFQIEPTCLYLLRGGFSRITVRLTGDLKNGQEALVALWKKHFPDTLVDFSFADDALESQYRAEQRFSQLFLIFSTLSLFIACLGLFALVSFSVETRTKEIGIRKVLGASVARLIGMFSREFLGLIVVAAVVAIPVGYYIMYQWLQGFAYRVTLSPGLFIAGGLLVLIIAWLTVSLRSLRAATANPVNSLRSE